VDESTFFQVSRCSGVTTSSLYRYIYIIY